MNEILHSLGIVNIDIETGIRYGVIHQGELLQAWADASEAVYPEDDSDNSDDDEFFGEPIGFRCDIDGYEAVSDEYGDIFVIKSPYYTLCGPCSPCAPGAGYLMDPGDMMAYCFGHDWFEDGKAPYRVFSVETGKEVVCEEEEKGQENL